MRHDACRDTNIRQQNNDILSFSPTGIFEKKPRQNLSLITTRLLVFQSQFWTLCTNKQFRDFALASDFPFLLDTCTQHWRCERGLNSCNLQRCIPVSMLACCNDDCMTASLWRTDRDAWHQNNFIRLVHMWYVFYCHFLVTEESKTVFSTQHVFLVSYLLNFNAFNKSEPLSHIQTKSTLCSCPNVYDVCLHGKPYAGLCFKLDDSKTENMCVSIGSSVCIYSSYRILHTRTNPATLWIRRSSHVCHNATWLVAWHRWMLQWHIRKP